MTDRHAIKRATDWLIASQYYVMIPYSNGKACCWFACGVLIAVSISIHISVHSYRCNIKKCLHGNNIWSMFGDRPLLANINKNTNGKRLLTYFNILFASCCCLLLNHLCSLTSLTCPQRDIYNFIGCRAKLCLRIRLYMLPTRLSDNNSFTYLLVKA